MFVKDFNTIFSKHFNNNDYAFWSDKVLYKKNNQLSGKQKYKISAEKPQPDKPTTISPSGGFLW